MRREKDESRFSVSFDSKAECKIGESSNLQIFKPSKY